MQPFHLSRRGFLLGAASLAPVLRAIADDRAAASPGQDAEERIAAIEKRLGGRLGVAALDTSSGRRIEHRVAERFPMCSTFKFLAVAAVLKRVDEKQDTLERRIAYGQSELLDYAPVTRQHLREGGMSLSALCAAGMDRVQRQYRGQPAAGSDRRAGRHRPLCGKPG